MWGAGERPRRRRSETWRAVSTEKAERMMMVNFHCFTKSTQENNNWPGSSFHERLSLQDSLVVHDV